MSSRERYIIEQQERESLKNLKERQAIAIALFVALAFAVPALVGVALGVATCWTYAMDSAGFIHVRDIHATYWGWLTDWSHDEKTGARIADPNGRPIVWLMIWFNIYVLYQLGEGVAWFVRGFARLARRPTN